MQLKDFLYKLAHKMTNDHPDDLYDYFIHVMDDNGGFLRTRYIYWDKELTDRKISDDIHTVCVAFNEQPDFQNPSSWYFKDPDFDRGRMTKLKMQVFYYDESEESFKSDAAWSKEVGYPVAVKVSM